MQKAPTCPLVSICHTCVRLATNSRWVLTMLITLYREEKDSGEDVLSIANSSLGCRGVLGGP